MAITLDQKRISVLVDFLKGKCFDKKVLVKLFIVIISTVFLGLFVAGAGGSRIYWLGAALIAASTYKKSELSGYVFFIGLMLFGFAHVTVKNYDSLAFKRNSDTWQVIPSMSPYLLFQSPFRDVEIVDFAPATSASSFDAITQDEKVIRAHYEIEYHYKQGTGLDIVKAGHIFRSEEARSTRAQALFAYMMSDFPSAGIEDRSTEIQQLFLTKLQTHFAKHFIEISSFKIIAIEYPVP